MLRQAHANRGGPAVFQGFVQTQFVLAIGGSASLDFDDGQSQIRTLSSDLTLTSIDNVPIGSILRIVFILTTHDIVLWPAAVQWVGGSAPSFTAGALKRAVVTLENDGTYLLASASVY